MSQIRGTLVARDSTVNAAGATPSQVRILPTEPLFPEMGKRRIVNGYIAYWSRNRQTLYEHRLVMENIINRKLSPNEHVHHINGNKMDNNPSNLEVLTNKEHSAKHHPKKEIHPKKCPTCLKIFNPSINKIKYCSSKCACFGRRKVERPSLEDLKILVSQSNRCKVARDFGVSETAVRKWLKVKMYK